jgi:hypothetical protein
LLPAHQIAASLSPHSLFTLKSLASLIMAATNYLIIIKSLPAHHHSFLVHQHFSCLSCHGCPPLPFHHHTITISGQFVSQCQDSEDTFPQKE